MTRDDWYRNTIWNEEIEKEFFVNLKRARSGKQQYLRIQASYLTKTYPAVALRLLDLYFNAGSDLNEALAYCLKAEAYLASGGDLTLALQSYETALQCETNTNARTPAYLYFSLLVATRRISERYARCLKLLDQHTPDRMFPIEHFLWHASRALILSELGNNVFAVVDAKLALEAANAKQSGFRYHSTLGLVGDKYPDTRKRLEEMAST